MEKFEWIQKYSVGVKSIDEQHQHYLEIVNDVVKMTGQSEIFSNETMAKIDDLNKYAIFHFTTEENLFEKYGYNGAAEHLSEHRAFEEKLDGFINKAKRESVDTKKIMLEIAEFAGSWLINHVMNTDQKYVDFMKENRVT